MSVSTRVLPTEATDAEIEENEFCVICRGLVVGGVGGDAKTPETRDLRHSYSVVSRGLLGVMAL